MVKQVRNETTTRTPPIPTLPALQLETRALLAWAERAFGRTREPTAMDKHAAGLVEAWIRERGGQRQVTAQQATLLRHASYAATLADVMWGAMQDGVVTDPRLLLEPIKLAALTLERVGLERVARDVSAAIRATRKPQVSLEGWLVGRQAPACGVRRKRSNDAALTSSELNRSYPGQDADESGAANYTNLNVPAPSASEPPHPRGLSVPPPRGTGVPTMHENRSLAGAGQPGPTGPSLGHEPGPAPQEALGGVSAGEGQAGTGDTPAIQPEPASAARRRVQRPAGAYLPSARRPGWHARSRQGIAQSGRAPGLGPGDGGSNPSALTSVESAPAVVDQPEPGPILYFPSKEEGHEAGPATNGE